MLAVFTLFSLTLWAAGFWEKKKFSEWSDKEVEKIMKDSPWSHTVEIPMGGGGGRGSGGGGGRGGGGRRGGGGGGANISDASNSGGGGGGDIGGGGGGGGELGGGGGGGVQTMSLVVRWHSAMPVKQAVARLRFGAEAATAAEAAKVLAPDNTAYVVGVGPMPMAMLRDPAAFKSSATISVKGKDPIPAAEVKGDRQGNMVNLYVFFPRAQAITVEDGEVEFAAKLNTTSIKRKFKLKEMMFDGKLEL